MGVHRVGGLRAWAVDLDGSKVCGGDRGRRERLLIGEVARSTGLSASAIRYYEARGVVPKPERTSYGHRDYERGDVDLLRFVGRLRALNLSLGDIGRVVSLRVGGSVPCGALRESLTRGAVSIDREIEKLRRLRNELEQLRTDADQIEDEWPARCVCTLVDPAGSVPLENQPVRVVLQYFAGCPNWKDTDRQLVQLGVAVEYQRIETPEEATEYGFRGSPTVLVNGVDPFFDPDADVGLACRVYRSPDGISGTPPAQRLTKVITTARHGLWPSRPSTS